MIQLRSYPPHAKQVEFLHAIKPTGVSITNFNAGRGSGKTHALVLKAYRAASELNRGFPGAVTEPTGPEIDSIFWPLWEQVIPQELWEKKRTAKGVIYIDLPAWGSRIYLLSRESKNSRSEPGRGLNLAWCIHDELAKDKDRKVWDIFRGAVRLRDAPFKFHDSTSTPKPNWYKRLLIGGEKAGYSKIIHCTSYDNDYVDKVWLDELKRSFDDDYVQQEIYANWVSRTARIWKGYNSNPWPHGNIADFSWDETKPFDLAVDLGNRSAWALIQYFNPPAQQANKIGFPGCLDVVVAEWTPDDGDTIKMVKRIKDFTGGGTPTKIFTGHDVGSSNYVTGSSSAAIFRNMGWDSQIIIPTGPGRFKEQQFYALSGLLKNTKGWRRFCISKDLISHNPNSCRGCVEVMEDDGWAEKVTDDYLPKDRNTTAYEHMRDALEYYAIHRNAPRANSSPNYPS